MAIMVALTQGCAVGTDIDGDPGTPDTRTGGIEDSSVAAPADAADAGSTFDTSSPPPTPVTDAGASGVDATVGAMTTTFRTTSYRLTCKLITNRSQDDETDNRTHSRFNLRGTDLGIPVAHGADLYFFFGDSAGRTIWPLGPESLPDAVGYSGVGLTATSADPSTLCKDLKFLTVPGKADFAGAAMTPPAGRSINEFIHNPSGPRGKNMFPNLPGDFEVPSGAFSYGGSIYVFYTIINHDPFEMRGAYLAKWGSPSTGGQPNYKILHHIDQRFDDKGPMRGDFVNIAPLVHGEYLYLYGTGKYRKSSVSLARKKLVDLEKEGGYQRFDQATKTWIAANLPGSPVITTPAGGELSVAYYPEIKKFMTLDSEGGIIMARFADAPEGPWSSPVNVVSTVEPTFATKHCCFDALKPTDDNAPCVGEQILHCSKAGLYGTYLLPRIKTNPDGSFDIAFVASTWDPYSVVLMSATLTDKKG